MNFSNTTTLMTMFLMTFLLTLGFGNVSANTVASNNKLRLLRVDETARVMPKTTNSDVPALPEPLSAEEANLALLELIGLDRHYHRGLHGKSHDIGSYSFSYSMSFSYSFSFDYDEYEKDITADDDDDEDDGDDKDVEDVEDVEKVTNNPNEEQEQGDSTGDDGVEESDNTESGSNNANTVENDPNNDSSAANADSSESSGRRGFSSEGIVALVSGLVLGTVFMFMIRKLGVLDRGSSVSSVASDSMNSSLV